MPAPTNDSFARGRAPAATGDDSAAGVLLLDIEPAMAELFDEWLSRDGLRVLRDAAPGERIALILIGDLEQRTLADIGLRASEIASIEAESRGGAHVTRRRIVADAQRSRR